MHKRRIIERKEAAEDVMNSATFIACRSFDAGLRFLQAVRSDYHRLAEFPGIGTRRHCRSPSLDGLRSVTVTGFRNWLILFIPRDEELEIVRVVHGAQNIRQMIRES